jgi:hypothetical protein
MKNEKAGNGRRRLGDDFLGEEQHPKTLIPYPVSS